MIRSALFGLAFWAMLAFAGWGFLGPIEGISFWRVFFMAGYAGYVMGLCDRSSRRAPPERIRLEEDYLKSFEEHHVAETADLNDEIERLQAALEKISRWAESADEARDRMILIIARAALKSPPSEEEE